jgi:hypothetical protein
MAAHQSTPMIPGSFEPRPAFAVQATPFERPFDDSSEERQPLPAAGRIEFELDGGGGVSERVVDDGTLFAKLWSAFRG